eukprot:3940132-Rhodomonas_salina.1
MQIGTEEEGEGGEEGEVSSMRQLRSRQSPRRKDLEGEEGGEMDSKRSSSQEMRAQTMERLEQGETTFQETSTTSPEDVAQRPTRLTARGVKRSFSQRQKGATNGQETSTRPARRCRQAPAQEKEKEEEEKTRWEQALGTVVQVMIQATTDTLSVGTVMPQEKEEEEMPQEKEEEEDGLKKLITASNQLEKEKGEEGGLSLIHISEPTRPRLI